MTATGSWPPTSEVAIVSLSTACDSALVVYINKGVNDGSDGKIACNPGGVGRAGPTRTSSQTTPTTVPVLPTSSLDQQHLRIERE